MPIYILKTPTTEGKMIYRLASMRTPWYSFGRENTTHDSMLKTGGMPGYTTGFGKDQEFSYN
jgi:hypothetical protein